MTMSTSLVAILWLCTYTSSYRYYAHAYPSQSKHSTFILVSRLFYSTTTTEDWDRASDKGKTLVIVESPAKAKTIQSFLDADKYVVDFCAGHIRDLPSSPSLVPKHFKKMPVSPAIKLTVGALGVDVFNSFEPIYVPLPDKEDIISRLAKRSTECSRILLASDEDREGEAISWHLMELLQPAVPVKRAVFHEITKSAIENSFASPRDIDMNLVQSQETRRILDRLAGFTLSPLLWRYIAYGLSAGRVQSCGLYHIAKRERKRWDFVDNMYFSINAGFVHESKDATAGLIKARLHTVDDKKIATESDFDGSTGELSKSSAASTRVLELSHTNDILAWLSGTDASSAKPDFRVTDIEVRNTSRKALAPFITSTLQQVASSKLGMSPSRTMSVAQSLYEVGFITYMRTDSPSLSATASSIATRTVLKIFGEKFLNSEKKTATKSKKPVAPVNAQEAHEAIRPTDTSGAFKTPAETGLSGQHLDLYTLIYRRTLGSVMAASQTQSNTVVITATKPGGHESSISQAVFRSSTSQVLFKGHSAVWEVDEDGKVDTEILSPTPQTGPKLSKDDVLQLSTDKLLTMRPSRSDVASDTDEEPDPKEDEDKVKIVLEGLQGVEHVTRAPSRFTEASFIKELESLGVGRPSTYAKILSILKERDYVLVDKQTIVPTVKGLVVVNLLEKHFPEIVGAEFTAYMEKSLDLIAHGGKDKLSFLGEFYLGDSGGNVGLLSKVTTIVENQTLDHKESRTLLFPAVADLGRIKLGSNGVYIEQLSVPATGSSEVDALLVRPLRWVLPEEMQRDIRAISREAIERIMLTEADTAGVPKGIDPTSGKAVIIRSGRYGRYLQVGEDEDKQKRTYSLPSWLESSAPLEDIIQFALLPLLSFGPYDGLDADIVVDVSSAKNLSVGVKGFPLRVSLPDGMYPLQVTRDMCLELLPGAEEVLASNRVLGVWNNEDIMIRKGRFGYYLKAGNVICGLGKLNHLEVTLEQAVVLLERKSYRMKKSPSSSKKSKVIKPMKGKDAAKSRKVSGYQVYMSECVSSGKLFKDAASSWKALTAEEKAPFLQKATEFPASATKKSDKTSTSVGKIIKASVSKEGPPTERKRSAYQRYISESIKGGMKLAEAASSWKGLSDEDKSKYTVVSDDTVTRAAVSIPAEVELKTKRGLSGYQLFVMDTMKESDKPTFKEIALRWKSLDDSLKEKLCIRARELVKA